MNRDVKISIIVPIHNGKQFLRETLDCIVNQTMRDIEVICVDDASTDGSIEILNEYMQNDNRIQVFQNEKSNAGAARNFGMDHAKGEYLLFWDGDDLFEPDACELMYDRIVSDNADLCVCNADHYDTEKKEYIKKPQYLNHTRLPETIPFNRDTNGKYILNFSSQVAWNKLFKASFIKENNIRFQEIPRINDHYFVSVALVSAGRITIADKLLIHYRVNQTESLTNTTSESSLCKYEVQLAVKNQLKALGLLENDAIRQSFVNKALNTMIHGLNIQNSLEGFKELYNTLKNEGLRELYLEDYGEDYFYNSLEYKNLQLLLKLPYDEYLFEKGRDYRANIEEKNIIISHHKKKEKELIKELNDIKKKNWYKKITKLISRYHKLIGKED